MTPLTDAEIAAGWAKQSRQMLEYARERMEGLARRVATEKNPDKQAALQKDLDCFKAALLYFKDRAQRYEAQAEKTSVNLPVGMAQEE
jgi:hypothetical protein